ncbi:MAG: hypothetical protein ACF8QF_09985 [Phycisphaerales bacterium]
MARSLALLACSVLLFAVGCTSARSYRVAPPDLGGVVVESRVRIDGDALTARTGAGDLRVLDAALITRTGEVVTPDRVRSLPDEWVGGSTVGIGVGFGTGYRGSSSGAAIGVGGSRPVGGRILPGPLLTEWDKAPIDGQPWTLVVQIETRRDDPPVESRIVLARVLATTPVAGEPGVTIDRLRLPDGRIVEYRVETTADGDRSLTPLAE